MGEGGGGRGRQANEESSRGGPHSAREAMQRLSLGSPRLPLPQLQVNVFHYYIFWFAFYALGKHGGQDSSRLASSAQLRGRGNLDRVTTWVSQQGGQLFSRQQRGALRQPYLSVLQAYLTHFLPHLPTPETFAQKGEHSGRRGPGREGVGEGQRKRGGKGRWGGGRGRRGKGVLEANPLPLACRRALRY